LQQRETSSSSPAQLKWLLLGEFPETITELLLPFMVFSFPLTFMLSRIKMTCNLPCLSKPLYSALASNFPPASALLQINPGSVHIRGQKFSPSTGRITNNTHTHKKNPSRSLAICMLSTPSCPSSTAQAGLLLKAQCCHCHSVVLECSLNEHRRASRCPELSCTPGNQHHTEDAQTEQQHQEDTAAQERSSALMLTVEETT